MKNEKWFWIGQWNGQRTYAYGTEEEIKTLTDYLNKDKTENTYSFDEVEDPEILDQLEKPGSDLGVNASDWLADLFGAGEI